MKRVELIEKVEERLKELSEIYLNLTDKFYGKVDILEQKEYQKKKYIKFLDNLKNEVNRLEYLKAKLEKDNGFLTRFKDYDYVELSLSYGLSEEKALSQKGLEQCKSCTRCECASCIKNCEFSSCQGCRTGSKIIYCDHESECLVKFNNYKFDMHDDEAKRDFKATGLCSVEINNHENRFLNFLDFNNDKIIVSWKPGTSKDEYDEIKDTHLFDRIVGIIQDYME